jgi:hypothetical protein
MLLLPMLRLRTVAPTAHEKEEENPTDNGGNQMGPINKLTLDLLPSTALVSLLLPVSRSNLKFPRLMNTGLAYGTAADHSFHPTKSLATVRESTCQIVECARALSRSFIAVAWKVTVGTQSFL